MSNQGDVSPENEEEKPLDPATEEVRQKLVKLLAVSIGTLVVGLLAVVAAVIYKVNRDDGDKTGAGDMERVNAGQSVPDGVTYEGSVDLPDGARITGSALDGSRLSLTVELSDGKQQIWLYDLPSARVFGRISID